jgi:hypothetical protein
MQRHTSTSVSSSILGAGDVGEEGAGTPDDLILADDLVGGKAGRG